ncbi:hypothetical protein [Phocaeicola coprocola]
MEYLEIRNKVEELNRQIGELERQKRHATNINEEIKLTNKLAKLYLQKECVLNSARQ